MIAEFSSAGFAFGLLHGKLESVAEGAPTPLVWLPWVWCRQGPSRQNNGPFLRLRLLLACLPQRVQDCKMILEWADKGGIL